MCYSITESTLPSGRAFETQVFGHNGTEFPLVTKYVPFDTAVNQVWWRATIKDGFFYNRYTKNPTLLDQFIHDIENELSISNGKFISICSGIGTPLDVFHSIDGLVVFNGKCAYFDITLRPEESPKPHIITLYRDSFESLYGRKNSAYTIAQKLIT